MSQTSIKKLKHNEHATEGYYSGRVTFRFEPYTLSQESGTCLLFAGQGAVYPGMFRDAYQEFEAVRHTFEMADKLALELSLPPISAYVLDPESLSEEQRYSIQNICLFTGEVGLYRALVGKGVKARALSAHSFGEYAALVASGALSFEAAFRFVCFREKEAPPRNERGFMIAVNGNPDQIANWLKDHEYHVANRNSESQTVIAVAPGHVDRVVAELEARNVRRKVLPTPQPYHSPFLSDMPDKLARYAKKAGIKPEKLQVPLVSSVTHQHHEAISEAQLLDILTRQMVEPVHFIAQLQTLHSRGCTQFIEIGPTVVLGNFVESVLGLNCVPVDFYTRLSRKKKASTTNLQKNKLWGTINKIISQVTGYAIEDISLQDKFQEDLGIDSIKKTEIIFSVLDEVKGDPNQALDTSRVQQVKDLLSFVDGIQSAPGHEERTVHFERYVPEWVPAPLLEQSVRTHVLRILEVPSTFVGADLKRWSLAALAALRNPTPPAFALKLPSGYKTIPDFVETVLKPGMRFLQDLARSHDGSLSCQVLLLLNEPVHPMAAAWAAFWKSLKKEFPSIGIRNVCFDRMPDERSLLPLLEAELRDPTGTDIRYRQGRRFRRLLVKKPLASSEAAKHSTLLAVGGAKGITFELLKRLLIGTKTDAHIWGRSPEPDVAANLASLRQTGSTVTYHQVDASDAAQCERALQKMASPDLILNGAGIEKSQLFAEKDPAGIDEEVFSKTLPLQNLFKAVTPGARLFHFSSVVSEFGNKGQALYAWANAWGNAECERHGATSVAWPPWDNVGMTSKKGIVNALKSQGVAMLAPDDAFRLFSAEVGRPASGTVFYCDAADPLAYSSGLLDEKAHAFLGTTLPGGFGRSLSYEKDPFLADHEIDGKAYLPGAVGISGFLALARLQGINTLRGIRFAQPLSLTRQTPIQIQWEQTTDGKLVLKSSLPHFVAELDTTQSPPTPPRLGSVDQEIDCRGIYGEGALFHGPMFQGIAQARLHGETGISLSFKEKIPSIWDHAIYGRMAQWLDFVFQGAALFGLWKHSVQYLPTGVDQVYFFPENIPSFLGEARVECLNHGADSVEATAAVGSPETPILVLQGIRLSRRQTLKHHGLKVRAIRK